MHLNPEWERPFTISLILRVGLEFSLTVLPEIRASGILGSANENHKTTLKKDLNEHAR